MNDSQLNLAGVPAARQADVAVLGERMRELAGESLLALVAYGSWLLEDPGAADAPARTVLVLAHADLPALHRMAREGGRLGRRGLAAPLTVTPEYLHASLDVFPLEFLEIQQVHQCLWGTDHFAGLTFDPLHVRLACERELKSELIQLRQELLVARGRARALHAACVAAAERATRIARGYLHLRGKELPTLAGDLLTAAAGASGVGLPALQRALQPKARLDFSDFQRCYGEIEALANHLDHFRQTVADARLGP